MASMTRAIRRNIKAKEGKEKLGLTRGKYFKWRRDQIIESYRTIFNKKASKKEKKQARKTIQELKF
ncbi:MAG: hypothetical protein ACOCRO_03115 [Halanaerobiales bacterium]